MGNIKQKKLEKNEIISASEIGHYYFCPMAWYLQKCGYKPESTFLDTGTKKHEKIGEIITKTQRENSKSKILSIMGYLILIFVSLLIFVEVIL